jgi:major membrane immunogen (membrane-anchored lipoprotein)
MSPTAKCTFHRKCFDALAKYEGWNEDNDSHREADMCVLTIDGETVWAKLDYYDKHDLNYGSEDRADPAKTLRIGTLLFPEEY